MAAGPTADAAGPGAGARDTLWLSAGALRTVLDHCLREQPREACGWLAGRWDPPGGPDGGRRGVTAFGLRAYPMGNVADDPIRRYLMDPEEQFAVLRTMRRRGEELVAIYHSHPATPPLPSATDIDLAYTKDAVYLIVSLAGPRPELRAWWLDCDTRRVEEVAVRWAEPYAEEDKEAGGAAVDEGADGHPRARSIEIETDGIGDETDEAAGGGDGGGGERGGADHHGERETPHLSR